MGFNPFRKQQRRPADVVLVVAALGAAALLILWAVAWP
jgi:hypothetical protein